MAVGVFTVFYHAQRKIGAAEIDLNGDSFKAVLCGSAQNLTADFEAGDPADALYADLTDEVGDGTGYTTGGLDLTNVTWTSSGGVTKFDADDLVWPALTKTGLKYLVIYDDTDADKSLVGFMDLDDSSPDGVDSGGADFTVIWSASGIFDLQQVASV